ncbi:Cadherin-23 [Halotydeus destructor]|nr:Cadherin-23 [Halotydeus destructor]
MNNGRIVPSPWVTCEVIIEVKDVNDNPPKFARKVFTGGVTTDQFYGTVFMSVKASDADAGVNSQISYYVYGPIRRSLDVGLDHLQQDPFLVNRRTGEISLNFDPRKEMKGYFEFQVLANDTGGLYDTANVYIYLLREDQRVRFVLWLAPQELREKLDKFIDILSNITGAMVNVDSYKFYENEDGTVDKQRTVLYLHFVDPADNSVMEVDTVLSLIDKNHMFLNELYREFHVLLGEASVFNEEYLAWDDQVKAGLVGSTAFLALLLILVICLCLNQRSRYKRQLRAATATSYGPRDPQLSRANVPNTNIHADEGSNPIWMTGYDNEWYDKDEEQLSTGSTGNSLDENAVAEVTTGPATPTDSLSGSGRGSDLSANDRQALCRGIGGRLTPNNIVLPNKARTNTVQGKKLSAPKPPTPPTLRGGDGQGSVNTSDSQSVSCKNSVNTIYISSSYPSSQQSHYHHNQQHQGNNLSIISLETTEL